MQQIIPHFKVQVSTFSIRKTNKILLITQVGLSQKVFTALLHG